MEYMKHQTPVDPLTFSNTEPSPSLLTNLYSLNLIVKSRIRRPMVVGNVNAELLCVWSKSYQNVFIDEIDDEWMKIP